MEYGTIWAWKACLPPAVQHALWSYDVTALDCARDKDLIIRQVLAHGTYDVVRWLRSTYSLADMYTVFEHSAESEWSPKTRHFWSLILGVSPARPTRASVLA